MTTKTTARRPHPPTSLDELDRGLGTWPDHGCAAWRHCLTCPFVRCVLEMSGVRIRSLAAAFRIHQRHIAGEPRYRTCATERISERTYYRYLALARAVLPPAA